jgi:phosphoribosylglycinamide formyltransferase-1
MWSTVFPNGGESRLYNFSNRLPPDAFQWISWRLIRMHMARNSSEDPRLSRLTGISLKLPEVTRKIYGSHAQFLVRKKTFAYFLSNHHGDGIVAVTGKVLPGDNKALAEAQPKRFYLPAYLAAKGWVALRLDVGKIDWNEVEELLAGSYILIAPKRLAEQVKAEA